MKALTWRVIATADTFLISYLVILKSDFSVLETASLIAALEVITKVSIYYFHERIWNKIKWGTD